MCSLPVSRIVAGLPACKAALKADALDFMGDGLITFLGLLAVGWSLAWRARWLRVLVAWVHQPG